MLNYRRDVWARFPRLVHLVRPPQHTESAPLAGLLAASAAVCLLSSKDAGPLNAGSMVGGVGGSAHYKLVDHLVEHIVCTLAGLLAASVAVCLLSSKDGDHRMPDQW